MSRPKAPLRVSTGALGANIERERQAANLTMRQLADMAGCTPSFVANIVSGKTTDPGASFLYGFATALGVRMEDLMGVPRVEVTTRYRSRSRGNRHVTTPVGPEAAK